MEAWDRCARRLRDLRLSVTDRCNFRCGYCMPRESFGPDFAFVPRDQLLRFEELARVTRVTASLGVSKVRITGGEPLLRRDLHRLVAMLADVEGIDDLALTTNGALLADQAGRLKEAGLRRVTVSLDALDPGVFRAMADTAVPVGAVLEGLDAAVEAGLAPAKVNAVVRRGWNEDQILPLAEFGREKGVTVRFIEYMDVGGAEAWNLEEVVPADQVVEAIDARYPLGPVEADTTGEVADRYRYLDGAGEVGVIASVTRPFCGDCTRLRLSATGEAFTCLFAASGTDLRPLLRSRADDDALRQAVLGLWEARDDRYSEERALLPLALAPAPAPAPMHYLGG